MAIVKVKPTSPGRRAVVKVVHKHLHKGAPEASLLEPLFSDPLSLVCYQNVLMTKGAIEQLKEMFA